MKKLSKNKSVKLTKGSKIAELLREHTNKINEITDWINNIEREHTEWINELEREQHDIRMQQFLKENPLTIDDEIEERFERWLADKK